MLFLSPKHSLCVFDAVTEELDLKNCTKIFVQAQIKKRQLVYVYE